MTENSSSVKRSQRLSGKGKVTIDLIDPLEEVRPSGMSPFTKKLLIILAIIAVCGFLLVSTCLFVCGALIDDMAEELELTVLDDQLVNEFLGPKVVGTARNYTGEKLTSVEAEVKFYGQGGVVLGTSSDYYYGDLLPGETWQFEVYSFDASYNEITRYKITVTGNTFW